ncbi:hypothetical protein [Paucibacter sp. Y2R2-4]|uniref:hypothetical protein n=1 Tax=Paucibacter sp. Y2R2-4 TaxID=2893553 RepID=UPI0021E392C3|nr:hypothetical protein [Paucibacter sp. Y2R2-4]MCV2350154.1 hypothetical protein [Paucibacter sp. Y2R2-4]
MNQLALGLALLAAAILYGAYFEYAAKNQRDAGLLAGVGSAGLAGSLAAFLI